MDFDSLSKVLAEVNKVIPAEYRKRVVDEIGSIANLLDEAANLIDDPRENKVWDKVSDNPKKPTFEDVIRGWETDDAIADSLREQPTAARRESGGSLDDIIRDIYRYVASNNNDYVGMDKHYEDWNVEHPVYIVVDFLQMVSEKYQADQFLKGEDEG